jgi:hypothetical protein
MIADTGNGTMRPRRRTRPTKRMTYGRFLTTVPPHSFVFSIKLILSYLRGFVK